MKDPHLIKQKDRNPAACPFFNFCTQFNEKALNIAPLDIAARRPGKNQFNNSLMPPFHCSIVPVSGTNRNSGLLRQGNKLTLALSGAQQVPRSGLMLLRVRAEQPVMAHAAQFAKRNSWTG